MATSVLTSHLHGFIRASGISDAQQTNSRMRVLSRLLLPERIHIENRLHASLDEFTRERVQKIFNALIRSGGLQDLTEDALRYYLAAWRPTVSDAATRTALQERLSQTKQDDMAILSALRRAADYSNVTFDGIRKIFEVAYTLWYESSGTALESLLHEGKYASVFLLKAASGAAATPFTAADFARVDIVTNTYPQLGEYIDKRAYRVTTPGFTRTMFGTMRDTIHKELYERMEGGLGARDLSKRLGEDLIDKYGKKLPPVAMTDEKLMLWARTEGCVVQNDGLLTLGQSAGMDGKQWFTVGDGNVRPAHSSNEAAGIIKMSDTFPDGSSDAGSGSTSAFNCRCTSAPALLKGK